MTLWQCLPGIRPQGVLVTPGLATRLGAPGGHMHRAHLPLVHEMPWPLGHLWLNMDLPGTFQ